MLAQISRFVVAVAAIYLTIFIIFPLLFALLGGLILFFLGFSLFTFITYHLMRWRGQIPDSRSFLNSRWKSSQTKSHHANSNSMGFDQFVSSNAKKKESVIDAEFERLDDK
jgi:hypothetical protein